MISTRIGLLVVASLTVACSGSTGSQGAQGQPGASTAVASVDPGGACSNGGASFSSAGVTAYACNGAKGDQGQKGDKGDPGVQGPPAPGTRVLDANGAVVGALLGFSDYTATVGVLRDGMLWRVFLDTGKVWTYQAPIYFTNADCTGAMYVTMFLAPQTPFIPFDGQAVPGEPVYRANGPSDMVTTHSNTYNGSCVVTTSAGGKYPVAAFGTIPGPFPAPLTVQ